MRKINEDVDNVTHIHYQVNERHSEDKPKITQANKITLRKLFLKKPRFPPSIS